MPEQILDVTAWDHVRVETRGASAKVWIREPGGSSSAPESDWLFKPVTVHSDGSVQVGNWTEAIASSLARRLGVPAAEARMAVRDNVKGVVLRNVRPSGYDMVTGRLAMIDEIDVETRDSRRQRSASVGHSLDNVRRTLERYGRPPGAISWDGCDAFDVMTGYLLIDALIGNGDRHEQNWSVLRAQSSFDIKDDAIAPTYDMEASLGFQLTDEAKARRLRDSRSLDVFARKGLARRFEGDIETSLVDVAIRSFKLCSATGRTRLESLVIDISGMNFEQIVEAGPPMSEVTRTFAVKVLEINERRIHDAINSP